ncbi:MAG: hypothetical protein AAF990_05450 [Bacteroidota bacterium]
MSNQRMDKILREQAEAVEGQIGGWQVTFKNRLLLIITDERANRMRIFTPIAEQQYLGEEGMVKLLEANFHSALDAKYCLYDDFIISVFTHPLQELTEGQFVDALKQVATLADNFGTTYSSTDFIFAPGAEEKEAPEKNDKRINKKPKKS